MYELIFLYLKNFFESNPSLPSLRFSSLFAPPLLMYVHSPGLLSSFGELEYACTPPSSSSSSSSIGTVDQHLDLPSSPILLPWNPDRAANTTYPITTYQPTYFVADRCYPIPFHSIEMLFKQLQMLFFHFSIHV